MTTFSVMANFFPGRQINTHTLICMGLEKLISLGLYHRPLAMTSLLLSLLFINDTA